MIKKLAIIYFLLQIICVNSILNNSYCGNIFGNNLVIDFRENKTANISANIFGIQLNCDNEIYSINESNILFSNNKSDCLNNKLEQYNACPCPPRVTYLNDIITIRDTPIGNIDLKQC